MAKIYFEQDGDLEVLNGKTVSVIGYGNQGRAQAQNLHDSGVRLIVGNTKDKSFDQAIADGFDTYSVAEAVQKADYHLLLVPDEIMPRVFEIDIKPNLREGNSVIIASGYNVTYGFIKFPKTIDLIMIAPRMIGTGVRNGYLNNKGFPSLITVHQDISGHAKDVMLAICKGIGTLKAGAIESSCDEETLCDLFNEHFGYVYALRRAYEILVEAGASPEAALLEFWASGEEMELARVHMTHGLFHQLKLHSQTSQYGQEVTSRLTEEEEEMERKRLKRLIRNIKDGSFAKDWTLEQRAGYPLWHRVHRENMSHPMIAEETRLLKALGVLEREVE